MRREPIKPDELGFVCEHGTMSGAISEIIDRFGGEVFTSKHIFMAIDKLPEYARFRSQTGFRGAVRDKIRNMTKKGRLQRLGQHNQTRYTAYRAVTDDKN
jgi:hypothetical protein